MNQKIKKEKITQKEYKSILEELHRRAEDLWFGKKRKYLISISKHLSKKIIEEILNNSNDSLEISYTLNLISNDIIQILSRIRRN